MEKKFIFGEILCYFRHVRINFQGMIALAVTSETKNSAKTPVSYEKIIHDWFLAALEDHTERKVSDLLGVTSSKLWKLKKAHQKLSAAELLLIHQGLGAPLPEVVPRGSSKAVPREVQSIDAAPDPTSVFDLAYNRVLEMENRKPPEQRASAFERLEFTFHIMKTIQETPEALGFEGAK